MLQKISTTALLLIIQDFSRQFLPFEVIKSIPLGLLPFGKPDKGNVPLAQSHDIATSPDLHRVNTIRRN